MVAAGFSSTSVLALTVAIGAFLLAGDPVLRAGEDMPQRPTGDQQAPPAEMCQLSAQFEKDTYAPCAPVLLWISIRNTTKHPVVMFETRPENHYRLVVRDERGNIVPLTSYGQGIGEVLRNVRVTLDPGKEVREHILLNRLYDMTVSGTYTVTAKRRVFRSEGMLPSDVLSKPAAVTIKVPDRVPGAPIK